MIEKEKWGEFKGEDVYLYTLKKGKYVLRVMTKGATIVYYGSEDYNAVLSHDSFSSFLLPGNGHRGEVVGPVANRIKGASFTLEGVKYSFERNFNSRHTLHSGSLANWGDKNWSVEKTEDNTALENSLGLDEKNTEASSITLLLITPDNDGGFPGNHEIRVTYTLTSSGVLSLEYDISSDKKCPVAVTNHAYFVLDDRDDRYVRVTMPAEKYIEVDPVDLIPLESTPTPVEGTSYDFRSPHLIGERRDGKYDNTWLLAKNALSVAEGNRAVLYFKTTEPGVQMYTGSSLPSPFRGVAFETGRCPDTPNRSDFPQAWTEKGKSYQSLTVYKIEIK